MMDNELVTFKVKKYVIKIMIVALIAIAVILLSFPVQSIFSYFTDYDVFAYVHPGVADPQAHVDGLIAELKANGFNAKQSGVTVDSEESLCVWVRNNKIEAAAELNLAADESIWDNAISAEYGPFVELKSRLRHLFWWMPPNR